MTKFDKFVLFCAGTCIILIISFLVYKIFDGTKEVVLSSKQFVCVEAEPFNLETRCVAYRRRLDK